MSRKRKRESEEGIQQLQDKSVIKDLVNSYFKTYGFARTQLDSYHDFMDKMVASIIKEHERLEVLIKLDPNDPTRVRRDVITMSNVKFCEPTATKNDGTTIPIRSDDARKSGNPLMNGVLVDMKHEIYHSHVGDPRVPGVKIYHDVLLCCLPTLLRSMYDPLYEDPGDPSEDPNDSGYCIINRNERVVQMKLQKANNFPHVQKPSPSLSSSASAAKGSSSTSVPVPAAGAGAVSGATTSSAEDSVSKTTSKKFDFTCEVRSWNRDKIRSTSTLFISVTAPRPGQRPEVFVVVPYLTASISMPEVFRMCGVTTAEDMKMYVCNTFGARDPQPDWEASRGLRLQDDVEENVLLGRMVESMLDHDCIGKRLEEITDSIGRQGSTVSAERRDTSIKGVFRNEFLPHMGLNRTPFVLRRKAMAFGLYVRKLLLVKLGILPQDDRDWIGNSSVDPIGKLMAILLRQQLRSCIKSATKKLRQEIKNRKVVEAFDAFNPNMITNGFKYWLSTGMSDNQKNSGSSSHGMAQLLTRTSPMSAISHINRLTIPFNKDGKSIAPRRLNPSHWGIFCAIETPEGSMCGLIRHLAMLAYVRTGNKGEPLVSTAIMLGMLDIFGEDVADSADSYLKRTRERMLIWKQERDLTECDVAEALRRKKRKKKSAASGRTFTEEVERDHLLLDEDGKIEEAEENDGWIFGPVRRALVFVNGAVEGWVANPRTFMKKMRKLKRLQDVPFDLSIYYDPTLRVVHLNAQAGTLMRPVLQMNRLHRFARAYRNYQNYGRGESSLWDSMMLEGVITMVDAHESVNLKIADSLLTAKSDVHTHCEIHPSVILGLVAAQTPFSPSNPSPRNTYVTSMDKQNTGVPGLTFPQRMDTIFHVGWYHQAPMVKTMLYDVLHRSDTPDGTNVLVMVGNLDGYQQEDAIIFSKDFLDRGAFRSDCYRTLRDEEKGSGADIEIFEKPDETCVGLKRGNYDKVQDNGFVKVGTRLEKGDICFGKVLYSSGLGQESRTKDVKQDVSTVLRSSESAAVDRITLSSSREGHLQVMMRIREPRNVGLADKFSSRHGQKGVVGLIVPGIDMPFSPCGVKPDVIVNPEAFPSRMTVGQLIENLLGMASAGEGSIFDATAFESVPIEEAEEKLWKQGINRYGQFEMINGRTGLPLERPVTIGIIHMQRLKRFAPDHAFVRKDGPDHVLTRQPVEGKSRDGGLRMGHMEGDCIIADGAADTLRDSLLERSDATTVMVCRKCGLLAHWCRKPLGSKKRKRRNDELGGELSSSEEEELAIEESIANNDFDLIGPRSKTGGWCRGCKTGDYVEPNVVLPYATKLCFQELEPMHIAARIRLSDPMSSEDISPSPNKRLKK